MFKTKYLLVLFVAAFLWNTKSVAQTTYVVAAAGGNYTTIAAAYAACAVAGTNYIIEIRTTGGTPYANAEVKPIAFAVNTASSIIIRPESGSSLVMSTGTAASIFNFTAGDNITIDGRAGGTGASSLTIDNTQALASKYALQFSGGSINNTIKYCTIKGANTSVATTIATGVIMFGAGTNSNNLIDNCVIQASGANKPAVGIMSFDATGNSLLTITNNNFIDFTAKGIWASTSQTGWTITGNSFYQTASFASAVSMLQIDNGGNYTVTANYFGGQAPNCGGAAYTLNTAATTAITAINFINSTGGTTNVVSGNTIQKIAITTTSTAANALVNGIIMGGAANYTCGSSGNGNVIGSASATGSVMLTNNAGSGSLGFAGIVGSSSGTKSIAYNTIAGITINGTRPGATTILVNNAAGTTTVDNNAFGSTTTANILVSSNSILYGISNGSASGITVTNNVFQNINHTATSAAFKAILNSSGIFTCAGNTINNISTAAATTHNLIEHAGSTATISNNSMHDISLTSTTTGLFNGIFNSSTSAVTVSNNILGSSSPNNINIACNDFYSNGISSTGTGSLTCTGNTIQNVIMSNTGTNPCFQGLSTTAGVLTFTQNTIQNIICNSSGTGNAIIGIYINSASTGHVISKNTVSNLVATSAAASAAYVTGIRVSGGSGLIEKTFIGDLQAAFTSATAEIDGMDLSTGAWDLFNNVVLIKNGINTNSLIIRGLYYRGTTSRAFHNTVSISGSVPSGTAKTVAMDMSATGAKTIENNILQNLRTGTGSHYAASVGNTTTSLLTNFNYLEVANNQSQVASYVAVDKNFAAWKTAASATNDLNGTITIDATGLVTTSPFIGAGTGTNLTAIVVDDKLNITRGIACWMGAYEGPNITTSVINPLYYCQGGTVSVPFVVGGGWPFVGGNTFIAQLSNSTGSFAAPTNIGTLVSTSSGTIIAAIPGGAPVGSSYRIRVMSSSPIVTGSDNLTNITVSAAPPAAFNVSAATGAGCNVFTANWGASTNALTYYLDVSSDGFVTFVPGFNNLNVGNVVTYNITGLIGGTNYSYRLRAENGCGLVSSGGTVSVNTTGTAITYVVDVLTDVDNGLGYTLGDATNTLRKCVRLANANCGHDIIKFNLGAGGPFNIALAATLPNLTDNSGVTIDGWDNSGNNGTPNTVSVFNATAGTPMNAAYKIILGNAGTVATGFIIASNNNILKGLVMQDFGDGTPSANDIAISISGNYNQILGCYIGLDATGTTRGTKTADGVVLTGASNKIGNGTPAGANLISGLNGLFEGILISGVTAKENTIRGNMIGLQKDGTTIVAGAGQFSGVYIYSSAISNTIGGTISGEGNVISGQNGANARGVYLNTSVAGGNTVAGNIIGPCADGVSNVTSNAQVYGVMVSGSPDNSIGGNTPDARNVISANLTYGIDITGAGSIGNLIKGNYIGINKNGTTYIAGSNQDYGIGVLASAGSNTIGGNVTGGEGNIISGNSKGVYITSTSTLGNIIKGNIIGLQADGSTYVASNTQTYGVEFNGAKNSVIGGNSANDRNILSGNENLGVFLDGVGCSGNIVKGNYIGTDYTGSLVITNALQDYGVYLGVNSTNNIIGGDASIGEGNVISGNKGAAASLGFGVVMSSTTGGDQVIGNIIGPQADGVSYLTGSAQSDGIRITGTGNIVGGNNAAARNIISANENYGVEMTGAACSTNVVKGNYIGIDKNGTTFITGSTQDYGVILSSSASGNIIGGDATAGEGNVISGNKDAGTTGRGLFSNSNAAAGNAISGNIIGPQKDGLSFLASNGQSRGIEISSSPNNTIGGNTAGNRNIISANEDYGVYIAGGASSGNWVKGNYIGIDKNGTNYIAGSTQGYGVYLFSSTSGNIIGGGIAGEGNVISGNNSVGIGSFSTNAGGNSILGNIIGPQADGISWLASNAQTYGIYLNGSPGNTMGGNTALTRNIISSNVSYGLFFIGAGCTSNIVKGNFIGLDITGTAIIAGSTQANGVYFSATSGGGNTIGGNGLNEGNIISGNTSSGINCTKTAAAANIIIGNYIGPQVDGLSHVNSNPQITGIYINGSPNNVIGGNTPGDRNIISANEMYGVNITAAASVGNVLKGNYIGPNSALADIAGSNQDYGISIVNGASGNTIGTNAAGENNIIVYNATGGVYVFNATSIANKISGNLIHDNLGKAININYGANQGNSGKAIPVITSTCLNTILGTAGPNDYIEMFKNTTGSVYDAATFVGATTADGTGKWSFATALSVGEYVIANATDASNNTSEFSAFAVNGGAGTWTWLGISTNWFDACNWDKKCLPDALSDVVIPGGTPNNPTITGATADCKTINISTTNSAHVNIVSTSSGHLNVAQ